MWWIDVQNLVFIYYVLDRSNDIPTTLRTALIIEFKRKSTVLASVSLQMYVVCVRLVDEIFGSAHVCYRWWCVESLEQARATLS